MRHTVDEDHIRLVQTYRRASHACDARPPVDDHVEIHVGMPVTEDRGAAISAALSVPFDPPARNQPACRTRLRHLSSG